jgi:hypothetical protein
MPADSVAFLTFCAASNPDFPALPENTEGGKDKKHAPTKNRCVFFDD